MIRKNSYVNFSVLLIAFIFMVNASPNISISTVDEWNMNIADGHINVIIQWDEGFELLYPGEEQYFEIPNLAVLDNFGEEPALAAVFAIGTEPAIGAWYYEYDEDPDLLNSKIEFSVKKRGAGDRAGNYSVRLVDENSRVLEWAWDIPVQTDANPWSQQTVVVNGGQQGATKYVVQSGFDGTKVKRIVYDYRGVQSERPGTYLLAIDHVKVSPVPEPSMAFMAGLGLVVARMIRKRMSDNKRE